MSYWWDIRQEFNIGDQVRMFDKSFGNRSGFIEEGLQGKIGTVGGILRAGSDEWHKMLLHNNQHSGLKLPAGAQVVIEVRPPEQGDWYFLPEDLELVEPVHQASGRQLLSWDVHPEEVKVQRPGDVSPLMINFAAGTYWIDDYSSYFTKEEPAHMRYSPGLQGWQFRAPGAEEDAWRPLSRSMGDIFTEEYIKQYGHHPGGARVEASLKLGQDATAEPKLAWTAVPNIEDLVVGDPLWLVSAPAILLGFESHDPSVWEDPENWVKVTFVAREGTNDVVIEENGKQNQVHREWLRLPGSGDAPAPKLAWTVADEFVVPITNWGVSYLMHFTIQGTKLDGQVGGTFWVEGPDTVDTPESPRMFLRTSTGTWYWKSKDEPFGPFLSMANNSIEQAYQEHLQAQKLEPTAMLAPTLAWQTGPSGKVKIPGSRIAEVLQDEMDEEEYQTALHQTWHVDMDRGLYWFTGRGPQGTVRRETPSNIRWEQGQWQYQHPKHGAHWEPFDTGDQQMLDEAFGITPEASLRIAWEVQSDFDVEWPNDAGYVWHITPRRDLPDGSQEFTYYHIGRDVRIHPDKPFRLRRLLGGKWQYSPKAEGGYWSPIERLGANVVERAWRISQGLGPTASQRLSWQVDQSPQVGDKVRITEDQELLAQLDINFAAGLMAGSTAEVDDVIPDSTMFKDLGGEGVIVVLWSGQQWNFPLTGWSKYLQVIKPKRAALQVEAQVPESLAWEVGPDLTAGDQITTPEAMVQALAPNQRWRSPRGAGNWSLLRIGPDAVEAHILSDQELADFNASRSVHAVQFRKGTIRVEGAATWGIGNFIPRVLLAEDIYPMQYLGPADVEHHASLQAQAWEVERGIGSRVRAKAGTDSGDRTWWMRQSGNPLDSGDVEVPVGTEGEIVGGKDPAWQVLWDGYPSVAEVHPTNSAKGWQVPAHILEFV